MSSIETTFSNIFNDFHELSLNPEPFLEAAPKEARCLKDITKKLFDFSSAANCLTNLKSSSLPKLLVDGFHDEQIWQQIELQNNSALNHFSNNLAKINASNLIFGVSTKNTALSDPNHVEDSSEAESSIEDADHLYNEALESSDEAPTKNDESEPEDENSDESAETENDKPVTTKKSDGKTKNDLATKPILKSSKANRFPKKLSHVKYKSEVEDQFFKLSKLEQFLRLEDLKEERPEEEEDDVELSEEEIDLFQDIPSDNFEEEDESEDEEISNKKSSRDLMYEDFFDAPESGDESLNSADEASEQEPIEDSNHGENDFCDELEDLEHCGTEEKLQNETTSSKEVAQNNKTPFELQQEKIKQQIEEYEENMLKPTAWHLTGEVDVTKRPADALLHLQTDFEMNAKPVVIQDKTLCEKLENMIKMTIKNKSYSDGVRQYKTNDEIITYKKEIVLEQTKSQKSLAQEYEDMYLKKQSKQEEEENPKHKEIKKFMDSLFPELQALFTHIPKPAVPEIKIVSNLPAVTVEEVAPTSVSDVTLLAPEEVKKRTGLIKGQTERTDVDRKRERRKKKEFQRMKQKKRENENSSNTLPTAKMRKLEKIDMLKKLKQHRNTKIASISGEKIKSSKDFFERLQDTVTSKVNKGQGKKKR